MLGKHPCNIDHTAFTGLGEDSATLGTGPRVRNVRVEGIDQIIWHRAFQPNVPIPDKTAEAVGLILRERAEDLFSVDDVRRIRQVGPETAKRTSKPGGRRGGLGGYGTDVRTVVDRLAQIPSDWDRRQDAGALSLGPFDAWAGPAWRDGPAGRYYAVAGDYVPQQAWTSPEYLEQLGPWTTSFELRDAQTETLSLRLANLEGAVW